MTQRFRRVRVVTVCGVSDAEGVDGPVARWVPDELLVASVMGSPRAFRGMTELPGADRAWLVAGLTLSGLTAADIASRLSCSLRLVKSIRAEDMTAVSVWAQRQVQVLSDQVRAEQVAHAASRQELGRVRVEADRLRRQVEDLVAVLARADKDVFPRCGHVKAKFNTYTHGRSERCRECRRSWQRKRLERATV